MLGTTNTVVDGYMLGWVGEIDIDDDGVPDADIVWWLELETWVFAGEASHYSSIGRIYDSSRCQLNLEGYVGGMAAAPDAQITYDSARYGARTRVRGSWWQPLTFNRIAETHSSPR